MRYQEIILTLGGGENEMDAESSDNKTVQNEIAVNNDNYSSTFAFHILNKIRLYLRDCSYIKKYCYSAMF